MPEATQKICILGPTYPYRGGIAHHTTLLCETLRRQHDVLFISFSRQYPKILFPGRSDKDPSATALRAQRVEYLLDALNPWTWYTTARRIARYNPHQLIMPWWVVFWLPQFWTVATLVRRWSRAKVVLLCHNVVEHEASPLKAGLSRFLLSRMDRIVTQSALETDRVRALLGPDAPVITGFHPTYAPLGGTMPDGDQMRKEMKLEGNVLLFFGFVRPYKGLDVLLEAMPRVLAGHDATLLVVGEFWKDKEKYLDQIQRLNITPHVRMVDRYVANEEIGRYFSVADLVVQPYRSATGSGVSLLAYGMQKPVIATRVGNLDDIIEDGVNGRLVPPNDPDALAHAITKSLGAQTLALLNKNARTTADRFSWDRLSSLLSAD